MSGSAVVRSIACRDERKRVDVFRRADGTFGFEELRWSGEYDCWLPFGDSSVCVADSADTAESEARGRVAWLADPALDLPMPLWIEEDVLDAIYAEARRAFPGECCGWLTAPRSAPTRATAIRPCANQQGVDAASVPGRGAETAYVIAGDDLLAFARAFDGADPPVVVYHSHPNGRAYFSTTDREVARSPWGDGPAYPVQQLVIGLDAERVVEAAQFAWSDAAGDFVEIARWGRR